VVLFNMEFKQILIDLKKVLKKVKTDDLKLFVNEIKNAKRVFVVGVGRSGLIAKNLAMRLVRLHKETYVVHETVNPKMKSGDLLITISGSGETSDVLETVKISRMMGAKIISLTANIKSPIAKLSHVCILIPAQIPSRLGSHYYLRELIGVPERSTTKSPFELCALIFLEVGVSKLGDNE